jgi:hypothetical protein
MKRFGLLALVILLSIAQTHVAEAAYSLKITVKDVNTIWMYSEKSTFVSGDPDITMYKKRLAAYAKTSKAKSAAVAQCKEEGVYYNTRIKVLDARNGTAGLGNLKTLTVSTMKIASYLSDLPEYTEEEDEELDSEYDYYEDYPDYIEEGYVSYFLEFTCSHVGTVSLISSNAYKIYIDGDFLGELSRAELIKMKWSISVLEEDI